MARLKKKQDRLESKITFRIDDKRLDELECFALREGMPVSFIVRHLVVRFLEDQRRFPLSLVDVSGLKHD